MTQYWAGTRHYFILTLYNFKNIGGHVLPLGPPAPQSLKYIIYSTCMDETFVMIMDQAIY